MSVVRLSDFRGHAKGRNAEQGREVESVFTANELRALRRWFEENKHLFKASGARKKPGPDERAFEYVYQGHDNRNLVSVVKTLSSGPDSEPSATLFVRDMPAGKEAVGHKHIWTLISDHLGRFISDMKPPPKALANQVNNISIRESLLAEQVRILVANSGEAREWPEGVTSLRKGFAGAASFSEKLPESWPLKSHEHAILDNCFDRFNNPASAMFLREPVSGAKCLQFGFFQGEMFQVTASIAFEDGRYGVFKAEWKVGDKDAFQSFADLSAAVVHAARFTGQELNNYTVVSQRHREEQRPET